MTTRTILKTIQLTCLMGALLLSSCYSTRNIPEDELLYKGIEKVDYPKFTDGKQQNEGVITAFAEAYHSIGRLLKSNKSSSLIQKNEEMDTVLQTKMDIASYKLAQSEVQGVLSYAPNASLAGSSFYTHPFPVGLWIYNRYTNSKSRFGKWMMHFASSPVLISTVNPKVRSIVAKNTLRNFGYFRAQVLYDTIPGKKPRTAKISYHVTPGTLFHTDSIAYLNFPDKADSIIRATMALSELAKGKPFRVQELDSERKRLSEAFRENGFYFHRPEYITFRADTLRVPEKVQLQVVPSPNTPEEAMKQYYIGRTRINVYKFNDYNLTDSLTRGDLTYAYSGGGRKPILHPIAIYRYVLQKKGSMYRQRLEDITEELISSMGVFSNLRINYVPRDNDADSDTLDIVLNATLDKPYNVEFQGNVTSKSNGQVGPGASFSMFRHNAFRGAETLGLKGWASYEWQTGANLHGKSSLINSYEYGVSGTLSYPRLRAFGLGRRYFRRSVTSTNYALEAKWMNRAGYFGRVSFGASLNYTIQKRKNIKHEFTPLSLKYDQLLNSTTKFDSIVERNPSLMVSMMDQFIPSMEYTYTWNSRKDNKQTLKLNVKEAGNFTSAIYAVCGEKMNKKNKELFGVPFAQFIKASAQYTQQFNLTSRTCLATRIFSGVIYSYGNALYAPYADLFSVGGANSIRAFAVRSIGPGSYHPETSEYSYIDQTGDFKLEANIEYRFPIIGNIYGAAFLDAGNVWQIRHNQQYPERQFKLRNFGKEIALGTGAGIRYDLEFLVLRLDVGVGIHAPYQTEKSGYYNMPSFMKSLGYHFAIGYPF